jgi:hypothetical protein
LERAAVRVTSSPRSLDCRRRFAERPAKRRLRRNYELAELCGALCRRLFKSCPDKGASVAGR